VECVIGMVTLVVWNRKSYSKAQSFQSLVTRKCPKESLRIKLIALSSPLGADKIGAYIDTRALSDYYHFAVN
jgi:hypothetical protein